MSGLLNVNPLLDIEFKSVNDKEIRFDFNGVDYKEEIVNYDLKDISPDEVKNVMSKIAGRYAYWSGFKTNILDTERRLKVNYDIWYAQQYADESKVKLKGTTETAIKNSIILNNAKDVKEYFALFNAVLNAKEKVSAILDAYELQSKMLQSIGSIIKVEFSTIVSGL